VTPFKKKAARPPCRATGNIGFEGRILSWAPCGESQRGTTAVFPRGRQILAAHRYSLTLQQDSSTAAAIPLGERHDALHSSATLLPSA
jgi:hypothetical protein